jgi:hypothetical protein
MKLRETRIRLEDADHERLRVAAARAGLSMSEFLKRAALEAIKRQEETQGRPRKTPPPPMGRPRKDRETGT